MSATDTLRSDHKHIKRLDTIITKCYQQLYNNKNIPINDLERINVIIADFLDSIHYSREEDSYFPCVASYDSLKKEIRTLMIEHEFSRRIASSIAKHLEAWKQGKNSREPLARFLRTYSIYLKDHMKKEERFFDKAEQEILSKEEEQAMYEQFTSVLAITKKISHLVGEIDYLEQQVWFRD